MKPPHLRRRVPRVKPGPGDGSRLCTWCAGTGIGYAGRRDPCPRCDGEGWVIDKGQVSSDLAAKARICRECHGEGGKDVRGGPGACDRCGRLADGRVEWWAFASGSADECDECGYVGGHDVTCSGYRPPPPERPRPVYRWADSQADPPVYFGTKADALAAAAFASDLPPHLDTLHMVTWPEGIEVVARVSYDARWLQPR